MDYTIIGAEANLAARLQSISEAAHRHQLRDIRARARTHPGPAAASDHHEGHQPRGGPLRDRGAAGWKGGSLEVFSEHMTGLDLYLDPATLDAALRSGAGVLRKALEALERLAPRR